jgi:two-component system chemotaxis response regulator CheB
MTVDRIRVLVVDDSLTVRKHLVDVLASDPALEVVGEAEDGERAIELCASLRPDIITLDMMMPGLSGLDVTEHVMGYCPTPILIVSASLNRGELFKTFDALASGAVDVLEKPDGNGFDESWERSFLSAVKLVSRIKVITHPRARLAPATGSRPRLAPVARPDAGQVVAIGASTGGPAAIAALLRALPASFPLPILLVLHIGKPFGSTLAEWLGSQSKLRVAFANDGEPLPADGRVVMAPPDLHLVVRDGRLRLTSDPERYSCRPSVDVLFESVARELGARTIACLLTGMGRDGAQGLLSIRKAGGVTFAQDEASSVVFGMPREAVLLGAASQVLSLDQLAPTLAVLAATGDKRSRP